MCKHRFKTVVFYDGIATLFQDPEHVFFTAWQCDDCGMLVGSATDDDVVRCEYEPPPLDKLAYWNALLNAWRDVIASAKGR